MRSDISFPPKWIGTAAINFRPFRPNSPLWDVVLVSFDLEPKPNSPANNVYNEIAQIRVSMLDTRSFSLYTPAGSLVTRHFVVGGHKRLVHTARRFHFRDFGAP
jgi:hypothetical protein